MSELPNATSEIVAKDNASHTHSEVVLLSEQQWSHVQKRYNLTCRERQIAELICQGFRNGSMAKRLRITPGTVKTHTRNIYRKVRVRSKIAMLLRFVTDARKRSSQYEKTPPIAVAD